MSDPNRKISRRKVMPLLFGSLLLPYWARAKDSSNDDLSPASGEVEEYQTLLKPDGTVVKVSQNSIDKARVVKKKISNKSLLGWLKRPSK